ncbi:hypothetical protein [Actinomadura parmotrematis]|uniref:hypothetical protein n=1 Tax=Actinomadura parmotrematis TaxID=2864039 RepID=UPI00215DAB43|nr:hypothetical protein [Actinomadura parmotrematis]
MLGYQMLGHHALFMASLGRTDLPAARHHAAAAIETSTSGQLGLSLVAVTLFDALTLLIRGDFDAAARRYDEVTALMTAGGVPNAAAMAVLCRFVVAEARGRLPETVPELEALVAFAPEDVADLLVHAYLAAGRTAAARAAWRPGLHLRHDYFWQLRLVLHGTNARALGDRDTAARMYGLLLPWADEPAGMHCGSIALAPCALYLAELAEWLGDPDAARGHRAAALRAAERLGSPHWARRAAQRTPRP